MQAADSKTTRRFGTFRVVLVAGIVLCAAIVALFAASSIESGGATDAAYAASVALAAVGFTAAILNAGGAKRVFWALLTGGLFGRVAGNLLWEFDPFGFGRAGDHLFAYALSYLFFFGAMLWLIASIQSGTALVAMVDAAGVMVAFGVLALYVVQDPAFSAAVVEGWRDLSWILSRPVCDLGLLFLALTAFRVRGRPAFVDFLVGGLCVFTIADVLYLRLRLTGPDEFGDAPELLGAGGIMLIGLAALRHGVLGSGVRSREMDALSFWLGLLLPPLLYGCALVWSIMNRPVPDFILFGGIVVMLFIAVRMALVAHLNRRLGLENEELARQRERKLLCEELHDGLKQRLHGLLLAAEATSAYLEKEDAVSARDTARDTCEMARETHRHISGPIAELGITSRKETPAQFLDQTFEDVRRHLYKLETRDGLRTALEGLAAEELGAVYRVVSEALWNAAKHSGARRVRVEARRVGSLLLINVHDDGRGFDPEAVSEGMGLSLMRERARRVGARLDIYSVPNRGTTVQMRFER